MAFGMQRAGTPGSHDTVGRSCLEMLATPPVKEASESTFGLGGLPVAAGSIATYIYASPIGKQKTEA